MDNNNYNPYNQPSNANSRVGRRRQQQYSQSQQNYDQPNYNQQNFNQDLFSQQYGQPTYHQGEIKHGRNSFFDGGLIHLVVLRILGFFITIFSGGILYPWTLCWIYGWKINHTVIEGHRMHFYGTPMGLFGNWIKWLFFMFVTIGIYFFWVQIKLEDWKVKNTKFRN